MTLGCGAGWVEIGQRPGDTSSVVSRKAEIISVDVTGQIMADPTRFVHDTCGYIAIDMPRAGGVRSPTKKGDGGRWRPGRKKGHSRVAV